MFFAAVRANKYESVSTTLSSLTRIFCGKAAASGRLRNAGKCYLNMGIILEVRSMHERYWTIQ